MDNSEIQELIISNSRLKEENEQLKIRVKELEEKLNKHKRKKLKITHETLANEIDIQNSHLDHNTNLNLKESTLQKTSKALPTDGSNYKDLTLAEYIRYGRQLILSDFGKSGIFNFFF